ncbi:hypothetical protein DM02DRAFT_727620 [Periconia macrospinosa]|uniref:C2H2-type domain-containing protein n=1 Tax=Periconia macrospinosa TaxID=97972 RepID=A0A2V1DUU2_9PLEO|nr:hypothetical protein DM02DRAFT_727620 [Periconia macrospinosa]
MIKLGRLWEKGNMSLDGQMALRKLLHQTTLLSGSGHPGCRPDICSRTDQLMFLTRLERRKEPWVMAKRKPASKAPERTLFDFGIKRHTYDDPPPPSPPKKTKKPEDLPPAQWWLALPQRHGLPEEFQPLHPHTLETCPFFFAGDCLMSERFDTQEQLWEHVENYHEGITPKSSVGWILQTGKEDTIPCPPPAFTIRIVPPFNSTSVALSSISPVVLTRLSPWPQWRIMHPKKHPKRLLPFLCSRGCGLRASSLLTLARHERKWDLHTADQPPSLGPFDAEKRKGSHLYTFPLERCVFPIHSDGKHLYKERLSTTPVAIIARFSGALTVASLDGYKIGGVFDLGEQVMYDFNAANPGPLCKITPQHTAVIASSATPSRYLPWDPSHVIDDDEEDIREHKKRARAFTEIIQGFLNANRLHQEPPLLVVVGADGFATKPLSWLQFLMRQDRVFNIVFALRDLEFRFGLRLEHSTFAGDIYHYFATDSDRLLEASCVWATPSTKPRLDTPDAHSL